MEYAATDCKLPGTAKQSAGPWPPPPVDLLINNEQNKNNNNDDREKVKERGEERTKGVLREREREGSRD